MRAWITCRKRTALLTSLTFASVALIHAVAQEAPSKPPASETTAPTVPAPPEKTEQKPHPYPAEYLHLLDEAVHTFERRDFAGTLAILAKADQIVPDTAPALNMRGAIAIEEKHFDEGQRYCSEALKKDPKFFPARFNLGEIPFMKKEYVDARAIYRDLLRDDPSNELVQYRIYMTYLLQKDDKAAQNAMKRIRFPGETGAYYYAQAAWEFAHGNQAEGMKWIHSGDTLSSHEKNSNFADVFYDLGWLKRSDSGK